MSKVCLCQWMVLLQCMLLSGCHASEIVKPTQLSGAQQKSLVSVFQQGVNLAGDFEVVSRRYRQRPLSLAFELNSEPAGIFDTRPRLWNELVADTLKIVRRSNPDRWILIGPVGFNHPERLSDLILPNDERLIATIHLYDPTYFTLQGAPWITPSPPVGKLWHPEQMTLNSPWHPASWDSTLTYTETGLRIKFHRKFAAFAVRRNAITDTDRAKTLSTLIIESDIRFPATALCNVWDRVVAIPFTAPADQQGSAVTMVADLSQCSPVNSIAIQLDGDSLVSPLISTVHLCDGATRKKHECMSILVTQKDYHQQIMRQAAEWSKRQQVPMYLGEFGVFDPAPHNLDQVSKIKWIKSMRESAEQHQIGWAFFEFANDFGVYNNGV